MSFEIVDCVKQASTSTGAGDFVLGSALTGFLLFENAFASLDVFGYEIHAVDALGARTGVWEVGIGQYWLNGATPTLRRLRKLSGSDQIAGTLISFAAGTKHISVTIGANQLKSLKFDGTDEFGFSTPFYVRSDGNDSNSGLQNTAAQAFLTVQGAISAVSRICRKAVIQVGAGAFDSVEAGVLADGCDITINGAGAGSTSIDGISSAAGKIRLMNLSTPFVSGSASAFFDLQLIAFSEVYDDSHIALSNGATAFLGDHQITGGAPDRSHIELYDRSAITLAGTVSITDDMTFGLGFMACDMLSAANISAAVFSLGGFSVTGQRYAVRSNSVIDTGGAGASFIPGSTSGVAATGGIYL
jgi:hypothetical protein